MRQWATTGTNRNEPAKVLAVIALLAALTVGCQSTVTKLRTSADVATEGLGLYIHARSNGLVTQAFVSPIDKNGMVLIGPTDKLFLAVQGGEEKPFVAYGGYESIAQIVTEATTFSIVLVRGSERLVSTMELPPPFALEAQYRINTQGNGLVVETRWTPSSAGSEMLLVGEGGMGRYESSPYQEKDTPFDALTFSRDKLQAPNYAYQRRNSSEGVIVTATRKGGKITLHPKLADIPHGGTLEQIRSALVTEPLPDPPPASIAKEPPP